MSDDERVRRLLRPAQAMREVWDDEVAAVYRAALADSEPPVQAVAMTYGISRTTATRWIRQLREDGLLDLPGRLYSAKVAAVAKALGIDPIALRDAVIEHAGGRLTANYPNRGEA